MDRNGNVSFECLRCGKVSRIGRTEAFQPRCSSCGSGTGVLGDIGQGTLEERLRRRRAASESNTDAANFECLRCGTITRVEKMETARPACIHCGSKDGVIVDGG